MRKTFSMLAPLLMLVLTPRASATVSLRHRLLDRGISALAAGRSLEAIQCLIVARRIDAGDPAVHLALGAAFLHEHRTSEAEAAFTDARALCPKGSASARLAQSGIGICLLVRGEFEKAAVNLEEYLASDPQADVVRACLAYALLKMGRFGDAASHSARVRGHPPVDSFALAVYGCAMLEAGAASDAANALRAALACCPGPRYEPNDSALVIGPRRRVGRDRAPMRVNVVCPAPGQVAVEPAPVPAGTRSVGLYVNGSLRQATNQAPYRFVIGSGLPAGCHTISLEAYDSAGRMLASAASRLESGRGDGNPANHVDSSEAVERLSPLLRPLPDRAALHYALGRALEKMGRLAAAANEYEACFAIRPDHPGAAARLAAAYRRLGISAPSDRAIARAPRRRPPVVALTFDDGPHPFFTPRLLEILRRHRIRATFFVVGNQVLSHPDLARQIAADGHEIGSHTFTHPNLNFLTPTAIRQEILLTKLALREVVGRQSLLFRPPGGRYGRREREAVAALGYRTVFWTSNIYSGKPTGARDANAVAARMSAELAAGGIGLLHNGRDDTLQVLPGLIERLRRKGVRFVTVSELGRRRGK